MAELSPLMQQYIEIKNQHKDEILFYRIGDFYEMFFDDALTVSKELDLTLTGKQCGLEERAPMCGVPFHSYENYVARLIAKGYKVAICEQMEDPAKAKGLVKRDIIRVVTPGTVIESSMLQDDRNNYIASIYLKGKKAGLCFADVSTGTAHITELSADKIASAVITELCRYHPSEVLMNPGSLDCRELTSYLKKNMRCSVELVEEELKKGTEPSEIIDKYLIAAINYVGELFEQKKYFLPQLIASAETMEKAINRLEPLLEAARGNEKLATIVVATVKGDIHDIGKNLVALMLKNYGYHVIDLGKDVETQTILDTAKAENASIIGLSALMTTTMMEMKEVVDEAKKQGVKAKIIIGGAVVTESFAEEIGADGYSADAREAVKVVNRLLEK